MQSKLSNKEEDKFLLSNKNDQVLRRVYSDVPTGTKEIVEDTNLMSMMKNSSSSDAERVDCECCGMCEDCTPTYISRVKGFFCGKWVCGLCSEAVKEKMKRDPALAIGEALESHMDLCKHFNRTIRLNPKLSLAGSMRDIARKSSLYRSSKGLYAPNLARTQSCGPLMGARVKRSSFQ